MFKDTQLLFYHFYFTAKQFGLGISLKKESMRQSYPLQHAATANIMDSDTQLKSVDKFCYLASYLCNNVAADCDVTSHIAKARNAFGKLQWRL